MNQKQTKEESKSIRDYTVEFDELLNRDTSILNVLVPVEDDLEDTKKDVQILENDIDDISTDPAGSDTEIQFNDGGSFGASEDFTFDGDYLNIFDLLIYEPANILFIATASRDYPTTISIQSGNGTDDTWGGDLYLSSGNAGPNDGDGGEVHILGGESYGSNTEGGWVYIDGGDSHGYGGGIYIQGGDCIGSGTDYGDGGDIVLDTGAGLTYNTDIGKDGTFQLVGTRGNKKSYRITGKITTTNNTPTNQSAYTSPSLIAGNSIFIEAKVVAERTGGTAGNTQDSAAYVRRALYKYPSGGALALVGSIQDDFTAEDQAGWDCTFIIDGNDIKLQVTGATNNNITWVFELFYIIT